MRSKQALSFIAVTIPIMVALTLAVSAGGWNQSDSTSVSQKIKEIDHIPIVDYDISTSTVDVDPQARALREAKDERYATRLKGVIADRGAGHTPILASSPYTAPLPALPVGRSVVIVLGEVINAQAYLTGDKTGIYSEFTISIEEILKGDSLTPVVPGSSVVTERYGGRVKFPSGHVALYGIRGQGLPGQGRHYVFFLERLDQQFSILTAYELRSGRVYPLDGKGAPGGETGNWAGDAYHEADATQFLGEVRDAVTKHALTAPVKGAVKQ